MSSAQQLNVFEEASKPVVFTEEDIPESGKLVNFKEGKFKEGKFYKSNDRLLHLLSPGESLWQSFDREVFLRYYLPAHPEFNQIIERLQQRRDAYLKNKEEQAKKRRFNQ